MEKSRFIGTELTDKWLGLVGCGNIGSIVANRALGMKMRVLGCDPYLSTKNAIRLGIEKVDFDELLSRADFITFHTPLKDSIRNIISADALNKTKKGVRIINCARGGLVDELAFAAALVEVDGALPAGVLDEIKSLPQVVRADSLQFSAQD